ncbi:MAG: hypothetical protein NTZ84_02980 [Candidatus Nealsonbacteria bacterium]|nr:hypothetical protein [Candidatus Nealsonbacteria bacterium]
MIENYLLIQAAMRFLVFNSIVSCLAWDSTSFVGALVIVVLIFILILILLAKQLLTKYKERS